MKKFFALTIILVMICSLAACSKPVDDIQVFVKGNIDAIYTGTASKEYLDILGTDEETCMQHYLDGLDTEAEFFCYYFGVISSSYGETYDDVSDRAKERIIDMYRQIYDHSKYQVNESVEQKEGGYTVQVIIDPIDIIETAEEQLDSGEYQPYLDFLAKYDEIDMDALSDDEITQLIEQYNEDYVDMLVDLIVSLIPNIGYKDSKSVSLQVEKDADGIYSINEDDWARIDDYMIYYP